MRTGILYDSEWLLCIRSEICHYVQCGCDRLCFQKKRQWFEYLGHKYVYHSLVLSLSTMGSWLSTFCNGCIWYFNIACLCVQAFWKHAHNSKISFECNLYYGLCADHDTTDYFISLSFFPDLFYSCQSYPYSDFNHCFISNYVQYLLRRNRYLLSMALYRYWMDNRTIWENNKSSGFSSK